MNKHNTPFTLTKLAQSIVLVASLSAVCLGTMSTSYAAPGKTGTQKTVPGGPGQQAEKPGPGGFSVLGHEAADEAVVALHVERMLAHLVPDATTTQKASIQAIAKTAYNDLKPLATQIKTAHQARTSLLLAASVDRVALEANRVESLRLYDLQSKRRLQADSDAAEVLTAAQRAKATEIIAARQAGKTGQTSSPFGK